MDKLEDPNRRLSIAAIMTGALAGGIPGVARASAGWQTGIGPLVEVRRLRIPADLDIVMVSGTDRPGDAGAGQIFVYDPTVDAAFARANPTSAFVDAAGRGFRRRIQPDAVAVHAELDRLIVSITKWGAIGDGTSDATGAIRAAIAHWKTLPAAELLIPWGDFLISDTITFDHRSGGMLRCVGRILADVSGEVAVRIGTADNEMCFGLKVVGMKVRRRSVDMDRSGRTSGSTGIELRNLTFSAIEISEVCNFTDNLVCKGSTTGTDDVGFAYNHIQLGYLQDGKRNLILMAEGRHGFCNENNFYGGGLARTTSYPNHAHTVNLEIGHSDSYLLNNNRFWGLSLEDCDARSTAAIINGISNCLIRPRLENSRDQANYRIHLTTKSYFCDVEPGAYLYRSNIQDDGTSNSWATREGRLLRAQPGVRQAQAVLSLQGDFSSYSKVLRGLDTSGEETFHITGEGAADFSGAVAVRQGLRYGPRTDRGFFSGTGSPERVVSAPPGSLYVNLNGGANATLYVKERGNSATGWVAK